MTEVTTTETLQIKVKIKEGCEDIPVPKYETLGSSGADLRAAVEQDTPIHPGETKLIPTGIYIAIPEGYEAQVRPRSGLALKHSIILTNSPGTVDSDYRGEIGVIMTNLGKEVFMVTRQMRIAQMVIHRIFIAQFVVARDLNNTPRGEGGFGHTGH